jgi:arginyl-tRNA synthetase
MAANKIEATLQEHLKNAIVSSSLLEEYDASSINIEIPKDKSHGDYSTNIAMQLTRVLHRNPREIAQAIMDAFSLEDAKVEKIEMAGPGFINFFMKNDALTSIIKEVLS